jgi:hypothetical protein
MGVEAGLRGQTGIVLDGACISGLRLTVRNAVARKSVIDAGGCRVG